MERVDAYEQWLKAEGLPVIRDFYVPDVMEVELKPWKRKGCMGAFLNLVGAEGTIDGYICEIPPGGEVLPQKHLYEELIYILSGTGASTVWVEGKTKQTFEWQAGSLFSPPLNSWHQHFNGQSDQPVRYLGMTRAPVFMNLFHDMDFIFNNDYVFKNRYSGEEDYFSGEGKALQTGGQVVDNPKIWDTNFVLDCRNIELVSDPRRGALSSNIFFNLSNGLMAAHISEFPGGTYMKSHYHDAGAHLLCLDGEGYELMWPADSGVNAEGVERMKIDFKKGTIFSPPNRMFHQHFNSGNKPTRLLAFHNDRSAKLKGIKGKYMGARTSIKLGGNQVDYEDEDPAIRKLFKEEIAKKGTPWGMSEFFPND